MLLRMSIDAVVKGNSSYDFGFGTPHGVQVKTIVQPNPRLYEVVRNNCQSLKLSRTSFANVRGVEVSYRHNPSDVFSWNSANVCQREPQDGVVDPRKIHFRIEDGYLRGLKYISRKLQGVRSSFSGARGSVCGVLGRLSRGLRGEALPDTYRGTAKCSYNKPKRQRSKVFVVPDLVSGELMAFCIASLLGCLYGVFRLVKYDRATLKVEGLASVILFLIGQVFVFLFCRRIYAL